MGSLKNGMMAVVLAASTAVAANADVTYVGVHPDVGLGWRNTNVAKPLDPDHDGIFGSAGYIAFATDPVAAHVAGIVALGNPMTYLSGTIRTRSGLPGFVSMQTSATFPDVAYSWGYAPIDDPADVPGPAVHSIQPGMAITVPPNNQPNTEYLFATLQANSQFPSGAVRVGFALDVDSATAGAAGLRVLQVRTGQQDTATVATRNLQADLYFFDLKNVQTGDVFQFFVRSSSIIPSTQGLTSPAFISFDAIPCSITVQQQPAPQSVLTGQSASFSVSASSAAPYGTLSFQWRRNGVPLSDGAAVSGSQTSALSVGPVGLADSGAAFDCVITNGCGSIQSSPAGLGVTWRCTIDFNHSGQADVQDIFDFLAAWFAGC